MTERNDEQHTHEAGLEQDERPEGTSSRRDFVKLGGVGVAGLAGAAALGLGPSTAKAQTNPSGKKRVGSPRRRRRSPI